MFRATTLNGLIVYAIRNGALSFLCYWCDLPDACGVTIDETQLLPGRADNPAPGQPE